MLYSESFVPRYKRSGSGIHQWVEILKILRLHSLHNKRWLLTFQYKVRPVIGCEYRHTWKSLLWPFNYTVVSIDLHVSMTSHEKFMVNFFQTTILVIYIITIIKSLFCPAQISVQTVKTSVSLSFMLPFAQTKKQDAISFPPRPPVTSSHSIHQDLPEIGPCTV